jgi:hypothetical protein
MLHEKGESLLKTAKPAEIKRKMTLLMMGQKNVLISAR